MNSMFWFNILKQPTLSMGDVGLVDLSNVPEEQKDDCNRRLKAYSDKIRDMPKFIKLPPSERYKDLPREPYILDYQPYRFHNMGMYERLKAHDGEHMLVEVLKSYLYNPIPEEVACKALELLNSPPKGDSNIKDKNGNDWQIHWYVMEDESSGYRLIISDYKTVGSLVHLEVEVFDGVPKDMYWPEIYDEIGWNDAKRQIDWR